jgi:hypothetical protein
MSYNFQYNCRSTINTSNRKIIVLLLLLLLFKLLKRLNRIRKTDVFIRDNSIYENGTKALLNQYVEA